MKSSTATHLSPGPEQTVADLAHLAWCALIALRLAQRDSQASSPLMTHTFLIRWLASAQKQHRFPRSVAPDIDSLLNHGRQKGHAAGLHQRLEYLWASCSSPVKQQSDLFRLTYAIETLKAQDWVNAAVADAEWDIPTLLTEYADVSALLVKKSDLVQYFAESGQLTGEVQFVIKGEMKTALAAFDAQAFRYATDDTGDGHILLTLLPD
ncbi:hypothetical protein D3C76_1099990 [compost metagenome]